MTSDLKPCPLPWCASPAKRDRWEGEYVCCSSEACPLSRAIYREETWNRRAPSPAVERLVEACKRLRTATDVGNWCDSAIKPGGCAWHISVEDNEALDAATDEVDAALAAVEKEIGQ